MVAEVGSVRGPSPARANRQDRRIRTVSTVRTAVNSSRVPAMFGRFGRSPAQNGLASSLPWCNRGIQPNEKETDQ